MDACVELVVSTYSVDGHFIESRTCDGSTRRAKVVGHTSHPAAFCPSGGRRGGEGQSHALGGRWRVRVGWGGEVGKRGGVGGEYLQLSLWVVI